MDKSQVIVGPKDMLATRVVPVREVNWLGDGDFEARETWELSVKIRSTKPPVEAVVRPLSATEAEVELLAPEEWV